MKTYALAFLIGLALAASATTAVAGSKLRFEVMVTATSAQGSMGSARASSDSNQFIGCTVVGGPFGTGGSCAAVDRAGVFKTCSVPAASAATMLPAIEAIGSASYIAFSFDASGNCTSVQASNLSYIAPM